jgi:hypothetical protein
MQSRSLRKKTEANEYIKCEDLFRDAGFDGTEICSKLREVATGSELVRLKHTVLDMLRRCRDQDDVACKYYEKLLKAPSWRVEPLVKEYMQYLKYLDCMRNYSDEKMCRRYLPAREKGQDIKVQNIEESLQKLPVEYVVEEGEIVVKVGKGEKLPEPQFKAVISELKKMGFEFDSDTKLWRRRF